MKIQNVALLQHQFGSYHYHALLYFYHCHRSVLPLLTSGNMGSDTSVCEYLYGSAYTDACCHTVRSASTHLASEYVSNFTECSAKHYPTGWAVCLEKVRLAHIPHHSVTAFAKKTCSGLHPMVRLLPTGPVASSTTSALQKWRASYSRESVLQLLARLLSSLVCEQHDGDNGGQGSAEVKV
jgi:hypothetical protein